MQRQDGWAWPRGAKLWHCFDNTTGWSLCGQWQLIDRAVGDRPQYGQDECVWCAQRVTQLDRQT